MWSYLQFSLETESGLPISKVQLEKVITGSEKNRLIMRRNCFIFFVRFLRNENFPFLQWQRGERNMQSGGEEILCSWVEYAATGAVLEEKKFLSDEFFYAV